MRRSLGPWFRLTPPARSATAPMSLFPQALAVKALLGVRRILLGLGLA